MGERFEKIRDDIVREISVHVTQRCNLSCKGCYAKPSKDDLAKVLSVKDLKWIRDTFHPEKVVLLGGEPLLYDYLEDALKIFADSTITLSTNGYFVPKNIDILKEHDVKLQISLDGKQEYNDYIRGEGSYVRAVQAGKVAKENDLTVYYRVSYSWDNFNDVLWLLDNLSLKTNIPLALFPRIETPPLDIGHQIKLFDKVTSVPNQSLVAMPNFMQYLGKNGRCNAGNERLNFTYDKKITPCHLMWNFDLGEIGDPLPVINTNRKSFIKTYKKIPKDCLFCPNSDVCKGGCLVKPVHRGCPLKGNFNISAYSKLHSDVNKKELQQKVESMTNLVKLAEIC